MTLSLNTTFNIFNPLHVDYKDSWQQLVESYLCNSGTVVFQQGGPANYLYYIVSGRAEISYKPYDGDPITVTHVEKGGWFGWSAVARSKYYTSSVMTIEPLEVVRVRGRDFRRICLENPEASKDLLERLATSVSGRWKHANEQVLSILTEGMRAKRYY